MASDSQFFDRDCVLMLHGDGVDASTTSGDSSFSNPKVMTNSANAQIDTSQSKFGGASMQFDGSGDNFFAPDSDDWTLGTQNTIDFWFMSTGFTASQGFFAQVGAGVGNFYALFSSAGTTILRFRHSSANVITINLDWNATLSADTWYHIALVKNASDYTLYQDGSSLGLQTNTAQILNFDDRFSVGGASVLNSLNGWLDEFRFVKGTAVWTSDFTTAGTAYRRKEIDSNIMVFS